MKIVRASSFLIDLEPEVVRTDAIQAFVKQETIFVEIETDDGLRGLGYSYTIGTGGRAVLAMLRTDLLHRLIGKDARQIEAIWSDLFWSTHATAVGAITNLALAAIDTALWDLRCLAANQPLWLAGGRREGRVPLYDTEGGWLQLSTDELVGRGEAIGRQWLAGVKLKVGKPMRRRMSSGWPRCARRSDRRSTSWSMRTNR